MSIVQEYTGNAELWIDDIFIRRGSKNIPVDIVFEGDRARLTLLITNHSSAVKRQNYDLSIRRLILLVDDHLYRYLNDLLPYRLSVGVSVVTFEQLITDTTRSGDTHGNQSGLNISPTARDRCILTQSGEGRAIVEIFALLSLHPKTIYQARQSLIKELGCFGLIDFQGVLRVKIFRN